MSTQTVMASVLPEEQFRCCICLDIYNEPVSIPCGHNFCLDCIEGFWDTKNTPECPLCKDTFSSRPELRINHGFADIIEFFKRSLPPTPALEENVAENTKYFHLPKDEEEEVPCDVCHGNKLTSVKSCLVCQVSYCDIHLMPHLRDPTLQRHRLTDPATFPTSHLCRNHNKPLTMFCKQDHAPVCADCAERDHKRHKMVPMEKESKRVKSSLKETKADVQQLIQTRLRKMSEIAKSMDLSKKITEREIQSSYRVYAALITAIEEQQAGLAKELEEQQQEAERRAEEMLGELEQEINDLQTRSSELQHLESTQNPLHLLQSYLSLSRLPSSRDWSKVIVQSDNCLGTARRAAAKLADVCHGHAKQLQAEVTDKLNQYTAYVTLDPETASAWLVLSPDGKTVSFSSQKKKNPVVDSPLRFDPCVCVLGKQSFTSGRSYWEVQVGDKRDWDLGVARESINRKGAILVRPDGGYWAICRRKGGNLSACAGPSITLHLQETPKKVGIFLDYEEGSVSFYDVEAKTHIYTFSECSFSEPVYPYFNPCVEDNGKNNFPLVICPSEGRMISEEEGGSN